MFPLEYINISIKRSSLKTSQLVTREIAQYRTMARLCVCLLALVMLASVKAATREYFIAAQDILWNYVPGGGQFKDRDGETFAETWTKSSADRIGPVYRKAAYFQYTDASFSEEIPKHPQLGLLGPLIRAEVGDMIVINFFNNATGNFSIHPHAVFYQKMNEGALYLDGTSGQDKKDDAVPPGKIVTQIWHVTENNSPTDSDPNCLPWAYHSHTDSVKDPAAGLLGVIVTCKKGVLDSYGARKDVDVDLPLVAFNWDENLSWYIDENIQRYCGDPARCVQLQQSADPAFVDSNRRRSLNGLQFSTMFGLQACAGSRVVFYNIGFGNEVDVHGIHFHGQDMKYQHTRGDTVSVYSATFVAAETTPQVPGDWLVTDVTENNERAGISAIFSVFDCDAAGYKKSETYGIVRRYFLTVEETTWNYAPSGKDLRTGQDLTGPSASASYMESDKGHSFYQYESPNYQAPSQSQYPGPSQIQLTYTKARFFQYTNGAFKYRVASPEHLGLVGPVLKAEVGDTLVVSLKNTIPFPVSFLPHGLRYDSSEEFIAGTSYPGGIVGQGEVHNYTFYVPTDLLDGSYLPCRNFLYSSTYDIAKDQNAGLVGVLLVCRKGYFSSKEYKPKEIFLLLSIIDESNSLYTKPNTSVPDLKAAINGYIFGNLPQLDVCTNENVIWYVMSVGSALDVHTLTFDGNTFDENGNNRDARYLTPGATAALSMNPDNPGRWMLYSHSNLARENGMFAFYNVKTCKSSYTSKDQSGYGKTRDYFVAADELLWDYAPLPRSIVTGEDLFNPNTEGHIFVRHDPYFIGKVHKKAVYREYTDDSFKLIKPGENRDILGPVMVAEVGDTIRVTFKNNARIPFSIHVHGLKTSQKDSGVNYGDATAVAPGQVYQYVWQVPERSGPGRNDPNCIPWVYYSSIDPLKDTNSGLLGGLVVCRKGILDSYSRRKDVDRELFTLFTVMNENDSWYLEENIKMFAPARIGTNYQNDPRFVESNKKHTINGRIYGNNQNLIMIYNQKVAWNVMGLGTEIDLHTVHFHGHTYVQSSIDHKDDVVQIFPGMAEVVEFIADDPGTWLFHCHVLDHIAAGMETYYTVFKPAAAQDSKAY
ncbi:hephaestin-like protein [Biomphalaria glabrata]|uniref:Hephaestin-like protein n=2 Tax=Biomphalaria glabrata TaxID=6526 RepID=A0A9W2Z0Q4_BIOGL|nr:hephaestin-like protein [Biomphalaria glabrata]